MLWTLVPLVLAIWVAAHGAWIERDSNIRMARMNQTLDNLNAI